GPGCGSGPEHGLPPAQRIVSTTMKIRPQAPRRTRCDPARLIRSWLRLARGSDPRGQPRSSSRSPMKNLLLAVVVVALVPPLSAPLHAQWAPPSGQWGKIDPADLRVMTWNVRDGICSTNAKVEGSNNWCALARIVAAMKPDILLLQECGDNSGNGSGTSIDSVADLITTVGYFLHGGNDSFHGGTPVTP